MEFLIELDVTSTGWVVLRLLSASYCVVLCCVVIYLCAEVGSRIPTFDFRYKKLKILPFMVTNVGKDGTFQTYSCFLTID